MSNAPILLTRRGRLLAAVLTLVLLTPVVVGLMQVFSSDEDPPSSFDAPIGALDESKVPGGWGPFVSAAAKQAGIPGPVLAAQLETESHWNVRAVSGANAQGLAQFTPDTWKTYGSGDPFDPQDAIAAQGRLMRDLKHRADTSGIARNHIELALAGYNAGFGNVDKYHGIPPFPETTAYVKSVAAKMGEYAKPLSSSHRTSTAKS